MCVCVCVCVWLCVCVCVCVWRQRKRMTVDTFESFLSRHDHMKIHIHNTFRFYDDTLRYVIW